MSHSTQDGLAPSVHERVLRFDHGLRAGDSVFLSRDINLLNPIQRKVVNRLNRELSAEVIDSTNSVYVFRITGAHTTDDSL